MNPSTPSRRSLAVIIAAVLAVPCARAQDGQTVDVGQMLQQLRQLRDQVSTKAKVDRQKAIQEVTSAASSGESAANAYERAVMAVRFDGANKEAAAFRAWRDGDGSGLKEPMGKNAARLYFQYLSLTLQRSSGTPVKDLLPALLNYTRELAADAEAMDALEDKIVRELEREESKKGQRPGELNTPHDVAKKIEEAMKHPDEKVKGDLFAKKMHASILQEPLGGSVVVQWLKLNEAVNVDKWENNPSDLEGIFQKTILPELRVQRDQRVLDYWDARIKREGEEAAKSKLEFEHDKFLTLKTPALLWKKAVDMSGLGMKNRAATEMFSLIRKYPTHPDAATWMAKLEEMLLPAATPAAAPAPAAP